MVKYHHYYLKLHFCFFFFGVSERKNQETNQLNGYSIPVCLWKKDEKPNQEEKDFYVAINKIHEIGRDYLEKNYIDNEATSLQTY